MEKTQDPEAAETVQTTSDQAVDPAAICSPFFVFDVESIGLHGEPYSVGWVVVDRSGEELDSGRLAINPALAHGQDDDREWCEENIPAIPVTHPTMKAMLSGFWGAWLEWKDRGALMAAECAWPVEAKFLAMCVGAEWPQSKWAGPYPLHDVASVMLAAGMDPMATYERLENEMPKHEPLADARQSARLLITALRSVENTATMAGDEIALPSVDGSMAELPTDTENTI